MAPPPNQEVIITFVCFHSSALFLHNNKIVSDRTRSPLNLPVENNIPTHMLVVLVFLGGFFLARYSVRSILRAVRRGDYHPLTSMTIEDGLRPRRGFF